MTDMQPPSAERLLFRSLTPADAIALQPILDDPAVRAALGWSGQYTDADQWIRAQLLLHQARAAFQVTSLFYPFAVVSQVDGTLIGIVQVKVGMWDRIVLTGELTVFLASERRGQGYGSEAVEAVVRWAFDSLVIEAYGQRGTLRQVVALCDPANTTSIKMLRKQLNDGGLIDSDPDEQGNVMPVRHFYRIREKMDD